VLRNLRKRQRGDCRDSSQDFE